MRLLTLIALIILSGLFAPPGLSGVRREGMAIADPVSLDSFKALPRPAPTAEIRYGPAPTQMIDLFLPRGSGPHPIAVLIHGGCWSRTTAGREQLRHLGGALADRGIAVWSIGYRRANEDGGGYPGTFHDVANAIDRLRDEAPRYRIDLSRNVLVGHSAGGHLALWAAARHGLPAASPLRRNRPFVPRAVISLAGVGDLEGFARFVPLLCGPGIIERLAPPYAEVSPAAMPAPEGRLTMVSGALDRLVPPYVAHDYARILRDRQPSPIELVTIPDAGHFDLVTPGTPAWTEIQTRIERSLRPRAAPRGNPDVGGVVGLH